MADDGKNVFVTVGTTSFDRLIQTVSCPDVIKILHSLGYKSLNMQIGRGEYEPEVKKNSYIPTTYFRYKDTLSADHKNASLVISHAGAGSVLEALEAKKPLIVVINEDLMGNHQIELAHQMFKDGHLIYCTCSELAEKLKSMNLAALRPYPPGEPRKFASFLDKVMGVS